MTLLDKHRYVLKMYDRHVRRAGKFIQPGPIPPNLPRRLKYWNRRLRRLGPKMAKQAERDQRTYLLQNPNYMCPSCRRLWTSVFVQNYRLLKRNNHGDPMCPDCNVWQLEAVKP